MIQNNTGMIRKVKSLFYIQILLVCLAYGNDNSEIGSLFLGKIFNLNSSVGQENLRDNDRILHVLREIGDKTAVITWAMKKSDEINLPIDIYNYKNYLSFQWDINQKDKLTGENIILYVTVKMDIGADFKVCHINTSYRTERIFSTPVSPVSGPDPKP